MALKLYDAANQDGLFNLLGKAYYVWEQLAAAYGANVPTAVNNYLAAVERLTDNLRYVDAMEGIDLDPWRNSEATLTRSLLSALERLAVDFTQTEYPGVLTASEAATCLVQEMQRQGYYVAQPSVSASITADASNTNPQPALVCGVRDVNGCIRPTIVPENLYVYHNQDASQLVLASAESAPWESALWPRGSGIQGLYSLLDYRDSLVPNAGFEDVSGGAPSQWLVIAGSSSTIQISEVEQQQVTISGSPSSGWYALQYTAADGKTYTTTPLAYNASGSALQSALRQIPELAAVTVGATGTEPNFTHTITFEGVPGNPSQLIANFSFNTGSVSVATTRSGDAKNFRGRALKLVSNGSEQTTLLVPVQLSRGVYALNVWAIASASLSSGQFQIRLVDGVNGNTFTDAAGNSCLLTVPCNQLSTSLQKAFNAIWSVSRDFLGYLELKVTTPWTSGQAVFLDEIALVPARELYQGGLWFAAFRNALLGATTNKWTITVSNNRAGKVLEYTHRLFGLTDLTLPRSGTTQIPESVIG